MAKATARRRRGGGARRGWLRVGLASIQRYYAAHQSEAPAHRDEDRNIWGMRRETLQEWREEN